MKNVLILASGEGSNFEAIIKYFKKLKRDDINFKLICNRENANVFKRAQKLNIEANYLKFSDFDDFFRTRKFDLVVMAGFDRILDESIIKSNVFINIHPSILPKYKGLNAIKKAFVNHDELSGITIHYATKDVDEGEIIYQKSLKINPKWSLKKLENEIHKLEHYYYPRIIEKLLTLNVLVIGSGAREHCIAEKISNSKFLNKLYLADCNDGFCHLGEKIKYVDYFDLALKAKEKNINLAIVGSEKYLSEGICDIFKKQNIKIIGADKKTAKLESSKLYAKKLMKKYGIKTAPYKKIKFKKDIDKFLSYFKNPVIKADGLALGKGVYINSDKNKVKNELFNYLSGKFQEASKTCLIEEKLFGYEVSLFSFWDGQSLIHLPLCQDFKQNDDGLNTGGLASICPVYIGSENNIKLEKYKNKINKMLKTEKINCPFILYSGLIITKDDIYVLEYNVRLGDPETQVLLNYIENDWLEIFFAQANKMLDFVQLKEVNKETTCVVMASRGYPLKTRKNIEINNIIYDKNAKIYFSNVKKENEKLYSMGGRVLSVVSFDKNLIYKILDNIDFEEKIFKENVEIIM